MTISPTYPGLYIQELPSSSHPITPAPTSVAVFVGYTHPFKIDDTKNFVTDGQRGKAVQIFSFADFERRFGGLYRPTALDANLARAVFQFFLNGGSVAWVVAIKPRYWNGAAPQEMRPATASVGGILFTSQVLTDTQNPMKVTVKSLNSPANTQADIQVTTPWGGETFRRVTLGDPNDPKVTKDPSYLKNRLAGSEFVNVTPDPAGGAFPSIFTQTTDLVFDDPDATLNLTTLHPPDFIPLFQPDSALDKIDVFNLLLVPGLSDPGVLASALSFAEQRHAFMIMDPPESASADGLDGLALMQDLVDDLPKSTNGALYFPYLNVNDALTGGTVAVAPSGAVAGIYARIDSTRGVWKAPAGLETILRNGAPVETGLMNDPRQGTLNPLGVNCLRAFPAVGTVVFGARTLTTANPAFIQWQYVPVRRMALFIEQTLLANLGWAIFEPNDEPLWTALRTSVETFMLSLFNQGAFQGSTPSQAFQVTCDATTTTPDEIAIGIVNIIVAFAPLRPAEFVVIKIAQLAGQAQT